VGHEEVAPLLGRAIIDEHVETVAFFHFEWRRETLHAASARPAVAGDEHAIARLEGVGIGIWPGSHTGQFTPVGLLYHWSVTIG
jgi:hypothetical protein